MSTSRSQLRGLLRRRMCRAVATARHATPGTAITRQPAATSDSRPHLNGAHLCRPVRALDLRGPHHQFGGLDHPVTSPVIDKGHRRRAPHHQRSKRVRRNMGHHKEFRAGVSSLDGHDPQSPSSRENPLLGSHDRLEVDRAFCQRPVDVDVEYLAERVVQTSDQLRQFSGNRRRVGPPPAVDVAPEMRRERQPDGPGCSPCSGEPVHADSGVCADEVR